MWWVSNSIPLRRKQSTCITCYTRGVGGGEEGGGGGHFTKVCTEAPPRGLIPSSFVYHFNRKSDSFRKPFIKYKITISHMLEP